MENKKYEGIHLIRIIAAIFIVLMHVLANFYMNKDGFVFKELISQFGTLVSLFMVISAFSMCCGYYNKIKKNEISLNDFYKKRYIKILPFFLLMIILDLIASGFSQSSLIEGFANATLFFAFLPASNISVIGVGWTLGVIFAFYLLFPFFVFLIWNKKRAWISLVVFMILRIAVQEYFVPDGYVINCNFALWFPYFIVGGIVYLYKDSILLFLKNKKFIIYILTIIFVIIRIINPKIANIDCYDIYRMLTDICLLITGINLSNRILCNKYIKYLGDISFEIYLSHMMIFRILIKLKVHTLINNLLVSYIVISLLTIVFTILFVVCAKFAFRVLEDFVKKIKEKN